MKSKQLIIGASALALVLVAAVLIVLLVPWSGGGKSPSAEETAALKEDLSAYTESISSGYDGIPGAFLDSIQYSIKDIDMEAMTVTVDVSIPADNEGFSAVLDRVVTENSGKTAEELNLLIENEMVALFQSRQFKTEKHTVVFPIVDINGEYRLFSCEELEKLMGEGLEELKTLCSNAVPDDVVLSETPEAVEMVEPVIADGTPLSHDQMFYLMDGIVDQEMDCVDFYDLDLDGADEMIGYTGEGEECYKVWFCSSDGKNCSLAFETPGNTTFFFTELLEMDDEIQLVLNTRRAGALYFSILALRENRLVCLAENRSGYVYMNDEGDILLEMEANNARYVAATNTLDGETYTNTFLFFDGNGYKEYGASPLSEKEFLSYKNAADLRAQVEEFIRTPITASIEYLYYGRKNGIVQIQCNVTNLEGNIDYWYFTFRLSGNELSSDLVEYVNGQIEPSLSDLEVVY